MSEIELCYRQQIKFDFILFIKRLQQEVSTRWNSSYYMLQNLLEQKRALGAYAADYELATMFTANQWGLIENMLSLLQPFEELTKESARPPHRPPMSFRL